MRKFVNRLSIVAGLAAMILSQSVLADGHEKGDLLKGIPSAKYNVDLTHASIVWKVSHLGFSTYVGRFNDFNAELNLDSADFSNSTVSVEIKVDSIDTAYPYPEKEDFDEKLSKKWFKSGDEPTIVFKSTKVSDLNGHSFTFEGEMTLAGQTHPVVFDAKLNGATASHPFKKDKALVGFSAKTVIDRTQWGVSTYAPRIGAEVTVEVEGEFLQAD